MWGLVLDDSQTSTGNVHGITTTSSDRFEQHKEMFCSSNSSFLSYAPHTHDREVSSSLLPLYPERERAHFGDETDVWHSVDEKWSSRSRYPMGNFTPSPLLHEHGEWTTQCEHRYKGNAMPNHVEEHKDETVSYWGTKERKESGKEVPRQVRELSDGASLFLSSPSEGRSGRREHKLHHTRIWASSTHPPYSKREAKKGQPNASDGRGMFSLSSMAIPADSHPVRSGTLNRVEWAALTTFRAWKTAVQGTSQVKTATDVEPVLAHWEEEKETGRPSASSWLLFSPMVLPCAVYSSASLLLQCILDLYSPSSSSTLSAFSRMTTLSDLPRSHRSPVGEEESEVEARLVGASWTSPFTHAAPREQRIKESAKRVGAWMVQHLPLLILASHRRDAVEEEDITEEAFTGGEGGQPGDTTPTPQEAQSLTSLSSAPLLFMPLLRELVPFFIRFGILEDLSLPPASLSPSKEKHKERGKHKKRRCKEKEALHPKTRTTACWRRAALEEAKSRKKRYSTAEEEEKRQRRERDIPQWLCHVFLEVLKQLGVLSSSSSCFPPPPPVSLCGASPSSPSFFQKGWYWIVLREWVATIFYFSQQGAWYTTPCTGALHEKVVKADAPPLSTSSSKGWIVHAASSGMAWDFLPFLCVEYMLTHLDRFSSASFGFPSSSFCSPPLTPAWCSWAVSPSLSYSTEVSQDVVMTSLQSKDRKKRTRRGIHSMEAALVTQLLSPFSWMPACSNVPCVGEGSSLLPSFLFEAPKKEVREGVPHGSLLSSVNSSCLSSPTPSSAMAISPEEAWLQLCVLLQSHPRYPHLEAMLQRTSSPPSSPLEEEQHRRKNWSLPTSVHRDALHEKDSHYQNNLLYYSQRIADLWRELNMKWLWELPFFPSETRRKGNTFSLWSTAPAAFPLIPPTSGCVEPYRTLLLNHVLASLS